MKPKGHHLKKLPLATIVLLHGSTGSGAMWHGLTKSLRCCFHLFAPDLIGYGNSRAYPSRTQFRLEDETAALEPGLPPAGEKFHLVGYSYGGSVALNMALADPKRVASLILIEPVAFGLLHAAGGAEALAEIEQVAGVFNKRLRSGDVVDAVATFVDYWNGPGAWNRLPDKPRADALRAADKIALDFEATLSDPARIADCANLDMPVMVLAGGDGPTPTRRITELLAAALPRCSFEVMARAGHQLPFSHASALAQKIGAFLGCGPVTG